MSEGDVELIGSFSLWGKLSKRPQLL